MSPHLLSGAARMAGSSLLRLQADERLVALVRDGHDPAFSALVDRYRAELLRYATRLVGDGRAEDVLQQAFLNAHTALVASENDIQLRPWLYRIAHNAALNVLRSGRAQVELDERLAAPGAGVAEELETRERLRDALAAIARLPEPQRDALTLQAIEGRSHDEIAAVLAVSPGAARQHLHRGRAAVRAAVSAVTPYGLMARFAMAGDEPTAAVLTGAGAGAGLAATATKVGAGVLAAGALATGTVGHVPFAADHHAPPAAAQRSAPPRARAAVPAPAEVAAVPARSDDRHRSSHGRSHSEDESGGRHRSRHGSSGDDDRSGHSASGDDDHSGHGRSGDDDPPPTRDSGDSGSSGDDGGGGGGGGGGGASGSDGGDDGGHSGSDDGGRGGGEDD